MAGQKKKKKTRSRGSSGLGEYRAKRSAERTPEPFSAEIVDRPGMFVVQRHAATNLHYDFRLELDGVLVSWAVPKGPSFDPATKRLAVQTEDHPLEYGDFEGIIPEGNYGAGAVIVWDQGQWIALEDPHAGMQKGKLLFELRGHKLRGVWTIFKTKRGEREWLMVKKPDAYAGDDDDVSQASVFSGLTVEELRDGVRPADKIRRKLRRMKVPRGAVDARTLDLMQAQSRAGAFDDAGWIFELKYDGFRLIGSRDAERGAYLRYRRGSDATATFPEIAKSLAKLPYDDLVLDGEITVLDDSARPRFQLLQQRFQMSRARDIQRASVRQPATWYVFDLLAVEGFDLRTLPLLERKKLLRQVLPPASALRYADHIAERGVAIFEQVREMGLEGIVAKRADSPYLGMRSSDWLKIRHDRTGDFVVVGYAPLRGGGRSMGALHLARYENGELTYAGRVGTGFTDRQRSEWFAALEAARRDEPPCAGPLPKSKEHRWVEPEQVVEVRYKEWTRDGLLRHPAFLRERDDKAPEECINLDAEPLAEPEPPPVEDSRPHSVAFTNLDKLFWPEEGYTKGDLIEYYRSIASWLLPYLEDRPLVLTRYPDGIEGKNFFQKDAPGYVPDWVRIETMWSEHAQREIRYFVADREETLLYLANMATIPLHIWSSRVSTLQHPDWCILDLDPKEAPFRHVVRVARETKKLCDEIGLDCYAKTSGSTGIHVLLPLGRQCTYEQSRSLGEVLARVISQRLPEIATVFRSLTSRKGRVYIDYVQNGHGRLLVSPFCVRPLPGAPVSMPLRWTEVTARLDIRRFTIKNAAARMKRLGEDPLLPVIAQEPDLGAALGRLHDLL